MSAYWTAGMQAVQMLGGLIESRQSADMQNKLRKARNKAVQISAGENMNAVIQNSISAYQQSQEIANMIQQEELATVGAAEVSAATAGVRGNSVDVGIGHIHRVAATKEQQRRTELQSVFNAADQQLRGIAMSASAQMDMTAVTPDYMSIIGSGIMGVGETFMTSKEQGGIGGMDGLKADWTRASGDGSKSIMSTVGNLLFK